MMHGPYRVVGSRGWYWCYAWGADLMQRALFWSWLVWCFFVACGATTECRVAVQVHKGLSSMDLPPWGHAMAQ